MRKYAVQAGPASLHDVLISARIANLVPSSLEVKAGLTHHHVADMLAEIEAGYGAGTRS
jgi:hypothetical protein